MARDLKMFMRGKSVTQLQNMLRQMGYPMEDQPAIFGACTRDGVKDFQKRKGLKVTGIVDDELMELMRQSVGFQTEKKPARKEQTTGTPSATDSAKLDALIRLLVGKGLISEEELGEALQPPTPRKKTTGSPLF